MLPIIIRTVIIYISVLAAMRLMGKRQLGELQASELVTTFLLSNVASLCIDDPDIPLLYSLVPIFLISSLEVLNSTLAWLFPRYAAALFGKPVTVLRDGKIDLGALERLRITGSDLAEAMRGKDVFSPDEVAWGVIEPNGTLSIAPADAAPMLPLLVDGLIYRDNLEALQLDEGWLDTHLRKNRLTRGQVLLLLYSGEGSTVLITKNAAQRGGKV